MAIIGEKRDRTEASERERMLELRSQRTPARRHQSDLARRLSECYLCNAPLARLGGLSGTMTKPESGRDLSLGVDPGGQLAFGGLKHDEADAEEWAGVYG